MVEYQALIMYDSCTSRNENDSVQLKKELLFKQLPNEVNYEINHWTKPLNKQAISGLTSVCKHYYGLFQPGRLLSRLLLCVANGDQDSAEKLLKINPEILVERGSVTDFSGRKFKKISPFEYMLWASDVRYMGNMMLDCLPLNAQGEMIKECLFRQFNDLEKNGVTYITRKGEIRKERHFDFSPVIGGLNVTNQSFYPKWFTEFAKTQSDLPAHVRQHICNPEELGNFTKNTFNRSLTFYNKLTSKEEKWVGQLYNFVIIRGNNRTYGCNGLHSLSILRENLEMLLNLSKMRSKDITVLNNRLLKPLANESVKCVIS